jgi:hypothetical protein
LDRSSEEQAHEGAERNVRYRKGHDRDADANEYFLQKVDGFCMALFFAVPVPPWRFSMDHLPSPSLLLIQVLCGGFWLTLRLKKRAILPSTRRMPLTTMSYTEERLALHWNYEGKVGKSFPL